VFVGVPGRVRVTSGGSDCFRATVAVGIGLAVFVGLDVGVLIGARVAASVLVRTGTSANADGDSVRGVFSGAVLVRLLGVSLVIAGMIAKGASARVAVSEADEIVRVGTGADGRGVGEGDGLTTDSLRDISPVIWEAKGRSRVIMVVLAVPVTETSPGDSSFAIAWPMFVAGDLCRSELGGSGMPWNSKVTLTPIRIPARIKTKGTSSEDALRSLK
jgi:hypothetical protein